MPRTARRRRVPWRERPPTPRFELPDGCALRLLEQRDADELSGLVAANREYLQRWMPWASRHSRERSVAFIRATREEAASDGGLQLAVTCQGSIVGVVGLHRVDAANASASVGYWLAADRQGRGTVTNAVCALLDHGFSTWNLHRVEIRAGVDNHRSRAIPERLGFRQEGTLREAQRIGQRYVDLVVYAMLASEWPAARLAWSSADPRPRAAQPHAGPDGRPAGRAG